MYSILLEFVAGIAITIERRFQLNHVRSVNRKMGDVLRPMLYKGAFDKPRTVISKDKSTIVQMLGVGRVHQCVIRRREDVEIAMEESMMEIIPVGEAHTV